jgi:hypothetical protein
MKKTILAAFVALLATAGFALAQTPGQRINTGGVGGAYHATFCPPIPGVLADSYFHGYQCATSAGTSENIDRVINNPTDLALVQFDTYARRRSSPDGAAMANLTIVRQDIACEGLWLVTKNPALTDFGKVMELARRIPFVLPAATSGSAATFNALRDMDPAGIGQIPTTRITNVDDVATMLKRVAESSTGEVGFFVQFADPGNANIKYIVEHNLQVIPLVTRQMLRAEVDGKPIYEVQDFQLTEGSFGGLRNNGRTVRAACTPVALITGNPAAIADETKRKDQDEMIQRARAIAREKLLPQTSAIKQALQRAVRVSGSALDSMVAAAEAGRQRMMQ